MKFNECSEQDRIVYLKDEFIRCIEELLIDPKDIQKVMPEDTFKKVMEYVPTLVAKDCQRDVCGTCIQMDKLEARIPNELDPVLDLARKRCEERVY